MAGPHCLHDLIDTFRFHLALRFRTAQKANASGANAAAPQKEEGGFDDGLLEVDIGVGGLAERAVCSDAVGVVVGAAGHGSGVCVSQMKS